jgi:dTDP-glucose 4,6-dehydratase
VVCVHNFCTDVKPTSPIWLIRPVSLVEHDVTAPLPDLGPLDAIFHLASAASIRHLPAVEDDPKRRCPDITRAVRRLDWRPFVQFDEGLKQTISWFTSELSASHRL